MIRSALLAVLLGTALAPAADDGFPHPPGAVHRFGDRRLRHPGPVDAIAVSPDGKWLATSGHDGVAVWDARTLRLKRFLREVPVAFEFYKNRGGHLAFLADSRSLLVRTGTRYDQPVPKGTLIDVAQVWDVETGKNVLGVPGPDEANVFCWPSAAGKEVAVFMRSDGLPTVRYFDPRDGRQLRAVRLPVDGQDPWVSPAGRLGVLGDGNRECGWVIDFETGRIQLTLPKNPVVATLSRDERLLVWRGRGDGAVRVHDLATNVERVTFTDPRPDSAGAVLSANNRTLYFGHPFPGDLLRWDFVDNKPGPKFETPFTPIGPGPKVLSPDGTVLYGEWDNSVRRWDTRTGKELLLPDGYASRATILVSADGKHLFVADATGRLDEWELGTGRRVRRLQSTSRPGINSLVESADGRWLAAGLDTRRVRLFDRATGKAVRDLAVDDKKPDESWERLTRVAFDRTGAVVYLLTDDAGLAAWSAADGRRLWTAGAFGTQMAVDPKGRWVVVCAPMKPRPQSWTLIDARTGDVAAMVELPNTQIKITERYSVNGNWVCAAAWLPDGSRLLTAHADQTVRAWDPETRKEVSRFQLGGKPGTGRCLAVSPDGGWVAVGGEDRSVAIWELATGTKAFQLTGHDSAVTQVAFTRDGRGLVSNADLSPVLWDLCPKDLPTTDLWEKLADADGARAYRAQWALIKDPEDAVMLLAEHLRPAALAALRARFEQWLADFDSPRFAVREAAEKELATSGPVPIAWLRKARTDSTSDEVRARLTRVLARREASPDRDAWRRIRAVQVLELIGSPEATELLKSWAAWERP